MPPETRQDVIWIVLFTLMMGMIGVAMVAFLMASWRRYNLRLRERTKKSDAMPDVWEAGRDRLVAKMSPFPRPGDSGFGSDLDDELNKPFDPFADPDDDDDDEPLAGR